jgi:hypothetical protein
MISFDVKINGSIFLLIVKRRCATAATPAEPQLYSARAVWRPSRHFGLGPPPAQGGDG